MTVPHPAAPRVTAVLLHWKGEADTLACIESLNAQTGVTLDLRVVFNGPDEAAPAAIRRSVSAERFVTTGSNLGYAGGNNAALRSVLAEGVADLVLVLNNDTVLAPDCAAELSRAVLADPAIGAAAPKSYYFDPPDKVYFAGGIISPEGYPKHVGVGEPDGARFDEPADAEWLTGCAILFRAAALRRVGLFEQRYFAYFEDVDWSLRARRAGYRLRYAPRARLWHRVAPGLGKTWSPGYLYLYTRNNLWWLERNFPIREWPRLFRAALTRIRWLAATPESLAAHDARSLEAAIRRGQRDYVLRRFGALRG